MESLRAIGGLLHATSRLDDLDRQQSDMKEILIDIQTSLRQITLQNEELQSDVFELHKRLVDLQEDSLLNSMGQMGARRSGPSSIPTSDIGEEFINGKRVMNTLTPLGTPQRANNADSAPSTTIGRLFNF